MKMTHYQTLVPSVVQCGYLTTEGTEVCTKVTKFSTGEAARITARARRRRARGRGVHILAVAAALGDADARRAALGRRLKHEGRVALRADFRDRLVPVDRVALRVLRAAVEDFPALRLLHDDLAAAARARARHARRLALDVLARRIVRARRELAVRPMATHKLCAVNRAGLTLNGHGRGRDRAGLLRDAANVSALRITRAAEEGAKAPALHRHRLAAPPPRLFHLFPA